MTTSAILETFATLRIFSSDLHPDVITSVLGVSPTKTRPRDPESRYRTRRENHVWKWTTEGVVQSRDNRDHVRAVVSALAGKAGALDELRRRGCEIDITCYMVTSGQGGPELDAPLMGELSALSLDIWWDVYMGGRDEIDSADEPATRAQPATAVDIRLLGPEHAAPFQALRLRGLEECPQAFASSWEEEVGESVSAVADRLRARDDGAVIGAFDGDTLVGIVGLQRESMRKLGHKAILWGMVVAPQARQRGVGQALVRAALAHAKTVLHARQVLLGVNSRNRAAMALYVSAGFVAYGTEPEALMHEGFHDEVHMVAVLR